jgi:hypothetical protein
LSASRNRVGRAVALAGSPSWILPVKGLATGGRPFSEADAHLEGDVGLLLVVAAETDHREVQPQGLAENEDPGRHLALGVAGEGRADHAERLGRHLHRLMRNPGPNHATDYLENRPQGSAESRAEI